MVKIVLAWFSLSNSMNPNSNKSSSNCQKNQSHSLNEGFPLPYPIMEFFCNPSLTKIDPIRIVGHPLRLDIKNANGELKTVNSVVLKDNFTFGALWGLLSGYCTKTFFVPATKTKTWVTAVGHPSPLERTKLISLRILRRIIIAGLLFDYTEQYAAKKLNYSHTNTMSIFAGLLSCAVMFPLCSRPFANAVYSSAVLGGYLIGALLPPMIFDEARRERRSK